MLFDYLDTKSATIAALHDWHTQHWKAKNGKEKIKQIDMQLTAIPSGMREVRPSISHTGNNETAFASKLDKKTLAMQSYEKACSYIQDMNSCWACLSTQDREILTLRFIDYEEKDGISKIMSTFNVSKREAYRMSDKALQKLAKMLYW